MNSDGDGKAYGSIWDTYGWDTYGCCFLRVSTTRIQASEPVFAFAALPSWTFPKCQ